MHKRRSSKPRNFAVRSFAFVQLSGGQISSCELGVPLALGESRHADLEINVGQLSRKYLTPFRLKS